MIREAQNTLQRREKIVALISLEGTVSVNHLNTLFRVSTVTIRNDLCQLERQGCLLRSYGGAMVNKQFVFDRSLSDKSQVNYSLKNRIAKAAAALVHDNDKIILDSGSTTYLMVPYLANKNNLVVMTNALNIAYELMTQTRAHILIAGGFVRHTTYSIAGPTVEHLLELDHFDKLFLGVDGFDLTAGITTTNDEEARVNRAMCRASEHVIAVMDSSKFNRKSFCFIEKIDRIQCLVTDLSIPHAYERALLEKGVQLILAKAH